MTRRGRRVALALAAMAGALFAGRGIAVFLVERWWVAEAAPAGAAFATRWALLRIGLEAGAIGIAVAWFAANLLLAVRFSARAAVASGSTLPPLRGGVARWWAVGTALLLGILCGSGASAWASAVVLFRQAPRWGIPDQYLGLDVGFHLATLPLLAHAQAFALALTLLGFIATTMLYAVAGALRVAAREFALDPAIRLHLGLLGASVALVIGAGYLLEPVELVAGARAVTGSGQLALLTMLARIMTGFAVAVAFLTVLWGVRGRMVVPVGAWASFALFGLAIRLLAPAVGTAGDTARSEAEQRDLDREAFAMPPVAEWAAGGLPAAASRTVAPRFWSARTIAADSGRWVAADRIDEVIDGVPVRALLLVAPRSGDGVTVTLVPDGSVTASGGPTSYRAVMDGAGLDPAPGVRPWRELPAVAIVPGAVGLRRGEGDAGVSRGGLTRRLLLSWVLQANLFRGAADDGIVWRRDPVERLRALAPFAEWGAPRPRWLDDRLVWISDGYLFAGTFPGIAPLPWRGRSVSYLRGAFLGVIDGESGAIRLFERGTTDPLAAAWSVAARGLVEPMTALPPGLASAVQYPWELFQAQSRILQRRHWGVGLADPLSFDSLAGPVRRIAFVRDEGRRVIGLLEGLHQQGADELRLIRVDSAGALDDLRLLAERWARLPFVAQMTDSVRNAGVRLELGRIELAVGADGLVAMQTGHAVDTLGRATLALVNLAQGARLGTGPRVEAAWRNLYGEVAALPFTVGPAGQLREAREWLLRADSAFRRGDLAGFARAFDALRAILDYPPGPAK